MEHRLKTFYFRWFAAIAVPWAAWRLGRHFFGITLPSLSLPVHWGPVVFILTAACGLAGPIFYRTVIALVWKERASIAPQAFVRFERNLILLGITSLALAMGADMLNVPLFYQAGTLLMALYAVYSTFPSRKRLSLDRRLFRVASAGGTSRLWVVHNVSDDR